MSEHKFREYGITNTEELLMTVRSYMNEVADNRWEAYEAEGRDPTASERRDLLLLREARIKLLRAAKQAYKERNATHC